MPLVMCPCTAKLANNFMAAERYGGCSWTSFNSHNFSTVDPMSKFLSFSESLGKYLPNDVIIHGTVRLANTFISQIWTLMTSFERYFSKLSENQKIFDFGSTAFKLWQLERNCVWTSFNSHNFSTVDPMLKFLWFSQKYFSNDVF